MNSQHMFRRTLRYLFVVCIIVALAPLQAMAACSPYAGLATLNEFYKDRTNQTNDADDFVEVKILDTNIAFSVYSQWTIEVCEDNEPGNNNDADGCSGQVSLSVFTNTSAPWLVLRNNSIGRYFNLKTGFDAILKDSNGDVIDYISVDGYKSLEDPSCTGASLPYDTTFGAPGASDKFIYRVPDGTGDWDSAEAASAPPTEDDSNDGGVDVPALSFSNVSIEQGTTSATVTLNLSFAASDDIIINFSTIDGVLTAGDDYTAVNTSGTISAGSTSITFTIPVSVTSDLGEFNFFVDIDTTSPGAATINNHTGTVFVTGPPTPVIDHYAISHSGVAVTCEAELVTITPHDSADLAVAPAASTTITLSTSLANDGWALSSGNGSFTPPNQYSFDGTETSVSFWLTRTTATTAPHMDIDVTDGSASDLDDGGPEDPVLEFRDTALRFYADGVNNAIGTQIAAKSSSLAPGNQTLTLRAVQTNTDTGACEARVSGPQTVQMGFECTTPTTCKTNDGVTIIDSVIGGAGDSLADNPAGGPISYSNVDLTFDINGIATWSMNYLDAGQIRLYASLDIPASAEDPADNLSGASNIFTSVPAGLCVSTADANADCVSGDASCSAFRKAGEDFNLSIRAVAWQAASESNTDFCSGNATTPNFQLANIAISQNLVAPAGGAAGSIAVISFDMLAADDGDHTIANQQVSEVGVFSFTASPPAYFGETIAASTSANIGRFYPDHFTLTDTSLTNRSDDPTCVSTFTYMDENFQVSYDLTARNVAGNVTQNYTNASGFAKLDTAAELNYGAVDSSGPTDLAARLNTGIPAISFVSGVANDLTDTLSLARLASGAPDGPYNLSVGIAPTDDDGTLLNSYDLDVAGGGNDHGLIATTDIYYGRLALENTFGSELISLAMPMQAEYFDGANFLINISDNCTSFAITDLILSSAVEAGQVDGDIEVLAGQTSTANIANDPLLLGEAGLSFCPPGNPACTPSSGNAGYIDVELNLAAWPWLQYDWDGDNIYADNPTARATFGIYQGNSKQIYYRQIYQ